MHDIYNRDQISKQDHDSHQQLSYDLHHQHHLSLASRPATCICPSLVPKISSTCVKVCQHISTDPLDLIKINLLCFLSRESLIITFHEPTKNMSYLQVVAQNHSHHVICI